MLNQKLIDQKNKEFLVEIETLFKNYGLDFIKLDKDKSGKRPDCFVHLKSDITKGFICECKYVASAGCIDDGQYHVSMYDLNLGRRKEGMFEFDSFPKIHSVIQDAFSQYKGLTRDKPEYKNYPFVIALEMDFFADCFDRIPRDIFGLKEISAVMKIEINFELRQKLDEYSADESKKMITGEIQVDLPPESKRLKVLLNNKANIPFSATKFFDNPIIC